jgi:succinate-semialdehyde dehydrogenase / glutarate-semialdehyde dehydrogenase
VAADLASITGMAPPTGLLIGGEWTSGRAGTLPVIDPATEDPIAEVASATPDDAIDAVAAAHRALPGWAATPPRVRGECLRRAFELMIADADALAKLMVLENGKALRDARAEISYAAEFFRWFA